METTTISDARVNDIVRFKNGLVAIVEERYPEDRASGVTKVRYKKDNRSETFVWDSEDPEIEIIAKGKITEFIDWGDHG